MSKKKTDTLNEYHLTTHHPDKPQLVIHDLHEYQKKSSSENTKPHIHSYYQIIWFTHGEGKHAVDFRTYDVRKNSIFFIAKNQVHYFDQNESYQGVLMHFNESFLVHNDDEVDFFLKYSIFNSPFQQPSCCMDEITAPILENYLKMLKAELQQDNLFGKEELLRALLKSFLIQVQRRKNECEKEKADWRKAPNDRKMQLTKFLNLLDDNFNKGLTITEYANLIHISARTLSDLTSQLVGKSPSQMLQERIILEAQRLLLHSHLNVTQIAYKLGFDDPSYFVKYFKKHSGQSPLEFRKDMQR
jgi:AraC-like DNA-binding protein